jgi:hypothetical protein
MRAAVWRRNRKIGRGWAMRPQLVKKMYTVRVEGKALSASAFHDIARNRRHRRGAGIIPQGRYSERQIAVRSNDFKSNGIRKKCSPKTTALGDGLKACRDRGRRFQVKRIRKPVATLSLRCYRSEHWIVVASTAK